MSAHCDDGHCVTCSDEGIPMRVLWLQDAVAVCEGERGRQEVMVDLVAPVAPGDEVLVHAGAAIARLRGRSLDGGGPGAEVPASPVLEREA